MRWIKGFGAVLIVLLVSLTTVKVVDWTVGVFTCRSAGISVVRSIRLREHGVNTDKTEVPPDDYMQDTENLPQKEYRLRTDKDGFIVGEKDFSKDVQSQKVDIIFWGGSTTECEYIDGEEARFPYSVSEKLQNKQGRSLRVLNGGMSGNNSLHSLFAFMAKGLPQEPSFVILMHAINDVTALSKTLSYWEAPPGREIIQDDRLGKQGALYTVLKAVKDVLLPNTWPKIGHLFSRAVDKVAAQDEWATYRARKTTPQDVELVLRTQFRASLTSFVRVARAWNIEPILMTQFNRLHTNDAFVRKTYEEKDQPLSYDDFVRLYQAANAIVREVARDENVFLIDLDKEVTPTSAFIYDAVHLNTNGSKVVADIIARALAKRYPDSFTRVREK